MSRTLRPLLLVIALGTVLGSAPLRAQETSAHQAPAGDEAAGVPSAEQGDVPALEDIEALRQRYRPTLHPGDPLRIVGSGQDGNELRAQTPRLARGEHTPLQIDIQTSCQRALALYRDGVVYHTPLPAASKSELSAQARRTRVDVLEPAPELRGPEATPWSVLAGLSVSGLLLMWFFVRVRPALVAPQEPLTPPEPQEEAFVFRPTRRATPSVSLPKFEPPSPLPQHPTGVDNGARMVRRPKQR